MLVWLPGGPAQAAAMPCHGLAQQHDEAGMQQMQHGAMHQTGAQHAPSGCHDCPLCYACAAVTTAVLAADIPASQQRADHFAERLASAVPSQPERPPRA